MAARHLDLRRFAGISKAGFAAIDNQSLTTRMILTGINLINRKTKEEI